MNGQLKLVQLKLQHSVIAAVNVIIVVIRPPDILVGGLRFYRDSTFFFCLLFRFLSTTIGTR